MFPVIDVMVVSLKNWTAKKSPVADVLDIYLDPLPPLRL